jgi:hypothetical protein
MKIKCPHCNNKIDLSKNFLDDLNKKIINSYKKEQEVFFEEELKKYENKLIDKEKAIVSYEKNIQSYKNKLKNDFLNLQKENDVSNKILLLEKDLEIERLCKERDKALSSLNHSSNSSYLKGKAGEESLYDQLKSTFPNDELNKIKSGVRGADILQVIKKGKNDNLGKIYYESKNTKKFNNAWIKKLKQDMNNMDCYAGILVTKTMPDSDSRDFIFKNGIYVTTPRYAYQIAQILRRTIIEIGDQANIITKKKSLQGELYDYINSKKFFENITTIINTHDSQKKQLDKEKLQSEKNFLLRFKQLEESFNNLNKVIAEIDSIKNIHASVKKTPNTLQKVS